MMSVEAEEELKVVPKIDEPKFDFKRKPQIGNSNKLM